MLAGIERSNSCTRESLTKLEPTLLTRNLQWALRFGSGNLVSN